MDRRNLTAREAAIAELVAQGRTNAEIARALLVSKATVKNYLRGVLIKWDCDNRMQLAAKVGAVKATRSRKRSSLSPGQ